MTTKNPNEVIFVNGKRIAAEVIEYNQDEGWVDIAVPRLMTSNPTPKSGVKELNPSDIVLEAKRLHGKVEVKRASKS